MKNRSRPFECAIAGKIVETSLRHGGGFGEPDHVYVRCDERDCQYVDLNQPPCPLRIDMFADGSDRRVAEHLATNAGLRFCYACVTEALGITHDQVRRASWRCMNAQGFSVRPSRCAGCGRRRTTIGLDREAAEAPVVRPAASLPEPGPSIEPCGGALASYLRAHAGYSFCVHCLAREVRMPIDLVREAMSALEPADTFEIRATAQCVSCLLSKNVIRYEERYDDEEISRRVIELLAKSPKLAFCPSCIAFATDIALADVKRIVVDLQSLAELAHHKAACSVCGRWLTVIGGSGGDGATRAPPSAVTP
jgi:hypothetical protein